MCAAAFSLFSLHQTGQALHGGLPLRRIMAGVQRRERAKVWRPGH